MNNKRAKVILDFMTRSDATVATLFRYGIVGGSLYLVDLGVFSFLFLNSIAPVQFANVAGKVLGSAVGFVLHKYVTYQGEHGDGAQQQAIKYAALVIFNLVLSIALVHVFVHVLALPVVVFRIVADIIVIAVSFLAMKFIVFRKPEARALTGRV